MTVGHAKAHRQGVTSFGLFKPRVLVCVPGSSPASKARRHKNINEVGPAPGRSASSRRRHGLRREA